MKFKIYTIGEFSFGSKGRTPWIRMQGKWLEDLDFLIGDKVIVYATKDSILITKPSEEEQKVLDDLHKKRTMKQLRLIQKEIEKLKK